MEGFCEQVVKDNRSTRHLVYSIILIIAFVVPVAFLMALFYRSAAAGVVDYFYALFALVIAMLGVFVIWAAIPRINKVEYDYSVYGSDFIVAKVTAKSSRKRKLKLEIKNIENLQKVSDENFPKGKYAKRYDFTGGADISQVYFAEFRLADKGLCLLLFTPNDKILQGMRAYLRHDIVRNLYYKK